MSSLPNFNALMLMNNPNFPTSPPTNHQEIARSFAPQVVAAAAAAGEHRRKKRSKLARIAPHEGADSTAVSKKRRSGKQPADVDAASAKITPPCSECGKRFWSWKALFGHMRCHPERQWRGINPPPNLQRRTDSVDDGPSSSPLSSGLTDEDHQVAASLVLLANGDTGDMPRLWLDRGHPHLGDYVGGEPSRSVVDVDQMADDHHLDSSSSPCRFECSSCKRLFGSHQALGGHRASHKNVKGCFAIARSDEEEEEDGDTIYNEVSVDDTVDGGETDGQDSSRDNVGGEKMIMLLGHKCGICMRAFSSGQALGGHKRCHWEKRDEVVGGVISSSSTTRGCVWDLNLMPGPIENEDNSSDLVLDLRLGI